MRGFKTGKKACENKTFKQNFDREEIKFHQEIFLQNNSNMFAVLGKY